MFPTKRIYLKKILQKLYKNININNSGIELFIKWCDDMLILNVIIDENDVNTVFFIFNFKVIFEVSNSV